MKKIIAYLSIMICALCFAYTAQAQNITLSGTVISSQDNQPVIGATVYIEGTTTGTTTDMDGNYSISVPKDAKAVAFACVGYLTKTIKFEPEGKNLAFRLVSLDESTETLKDAVVMAFGTTQRKETMVSSVQTVAPDILKTPSASLSTSFAGNIAGVIATQSSGEPGADGATYWIRGISTFGANTHPLFILDGVEVNATVVNGIAPESIESFSVLKDASATALYGSRGANGVMIITTKDGRTSEKMQVNASVNFTVAQPTFVPQVANAVDYMTYHNESYVNRGMPKYWDDEKIENTFNNVNPIAYPNTNWYNTLFKNLSLSEGANVSIRGGGKRVDYFLNVFFQNDGGMLRNVPNLNYDTELRYQSLSVQSNVTAKITNTTKLSFKMNNILRFRYGTTASPDNLFAQTLYANPAQFAPTYQSIMPDADHVVYGNAASWAGGLVGMNPLATMGTGYGQTHSSYTTTTLRLDQDFKFLLPGLKAWAQVSFYNQSTSGRNYSTIPHYYNLSDAWQDPITEDWIYTLTPIGTEGTNFFTVSKSFTGSRIIQFQGSLEYKQTFGKHDVNAVILYHQKNTVDNAPSNYYSMLPQREQGIAGRLSYSYDERYIAEFDFGYNGSENFMAGHRWGFFPSMAVGWIVSKEPWWKIGDWFDFLKVRYSFGYSGNDYLAQRFPYISTVTMGGASKFRMGDNFVQQKYNVVSTYGNEDATWELSQKHDLGLEFGLFKGLDIIADFYSEYRDGIFMQRNTLPSYVGVSGSEPYGNLGAVINRGVDISAEYKKIINRDWTITARGTFTYAHNEMVKKDESPFKQDYYTSQIGKPINAIYGYVADGLFASEEDIATSPYQDFGYIYKPGDIKYRDLNGDGIVNANDRTYIGYPTVPEIMYGFGAQITWKKLDFGFFFQGRDRVSILMSDIHPFHNAASQGFNMMQWIADDHYSEINPNPNAAYPLLDYGWNLNNTLTSTFWVKDGKFLRLKNVELGYKPVDFMRIYFIGTNLFILSPFKYWDAELGGGNGLSYPLQMTFQLGLQFNF